MSPFWVAVIVFEVSMCVMALLLGYLWGQSRSQREAYEEEEGRRRSEPVRHLLAPSFAKAAELDLRDRAAQDAETKHLAVVAPGRHRRAS